MEKYTASYVNNDNNFVIQNIEEKPDIKSPVYPAVCVLKNILMRGTPTIMSEYLQEKFGSDMHKTEAVPLIDRSVPSWSMTIKGSEENNDYPAYTFFHEIIPEYLDEYRYIQPLILPEAEINDIVGEYNAQFVSQCVDFYLPQAKLVIEIDGAQHSGEAYVEAYDSSRDEYLSRHQIHTVRIDTKDVKGKTDVLGEKMIEIEKRLEAYKNKLEGYADFFDRPMLYSIHNSAFKATAVMRFQILVLSLLEKGIISIGEKEWRFNILERDVKGFAELAVEDLLLWLENLINLQKMTTFRRPEVIITTCSERYFHLVNDAVNIDFSILRRWSDENFASGSRNVVFVRTDYFDDRDYFTVSTCSKPVDYKGLNLDEGSLDIRRLEFMLKNIFGFDKFREGQLICIENILKGNDTLGILPTGGGKSLIYQFTCMLKPCVSFVVVPIIALMKDQKDHMDDIYISHTAFINSTQDPKSKGGVIKDFGRGRYQFVWISPERFQTREFRDVLTNMQREYLIGMAVIDEVHCLSEWGHDFRTSYLNLAKTIRRYCSRAEVLCLTATASVNVQTDIRNEFGISKENLKTVPKFTREELTFIVERTGTEDKYDVLCRRLEKLSSKKDIFKLDGEKTKAGIIFCRFKDKRKYGCYGLANMLSGKFKTDVRWYSGKAPKDYKGNETEFAEYKEKVQDDFSHNEFPLLAATKAYGMGVDKGNVRYTIHYGLPESMEALYQEAGRAGRDKNPSACYVIFSEEVEGARYLDKILFNVKSTVSDINDLAESLKFKGRDVFDNIFFWRADRDNLDVEQKNINSIFKLLRPAGRIRLYGEKLKLSKQKMERAIYKLALLGIVEDWTISDWDPAKSVIDVVCCNYAEESVEYHLIEYLAKYGDYLDFRTNVNAGKYQHYYDIYSNNAQKNSKTDNLIKILLSWQYDNIAYNRRMQIQTVYNLCLNCEGRPEAFKRYIESYFYVGEVAYLYDHISEVPYDFECWFKTFYDNDVIKDNDEFEKCKGALRRLLESFKYNTGLNYISGILRLFTSDYDDEDARHRFEMALFDIAELSDDKQRYIFDETYRLAFFMSDESKEKLAAVLTEMFPDHVYEIHDGIKDECSLYKVIELSKNRINTKLGGLF